MESETPQSSTSQPSGSHSATPPPRAKYYERETNDTLRVCGSALVVVSVLSFCSIVIIQISGLLSGAKNKAPAPTSGWDFLYQQSTTIIIFIIAYVALSTGRRLISTTQVTETVPAEDRSLIEAAIEKDPNPIDQYLRLRSLSGFTGNFTKLQITGLPLATIFLTLFFAIVSVAPKLDATIAKEFLDLAKLTLGAFIGSFVQGRVEQRKQQQAEAKGKTASQLPPV